MLYTLFKLVDKYQEYYHFLKVAFVIRNQLSMTDQQIIQRLKVIYCATNTNEVFMMIDVALNNDLVNLISPYTLPNYVTYILKDNYQ